MRRLRVPSVDLRSFFNLLGHREPLVCLALVLWVSIASSPVFGASERGDGSEDQRSRRTLPSLDREHMVALDQVDPSQMTDRDMQALVGYLEDPSPRVRGRAVSLLSRNGSFVTLRQILCRILHDPHYYPRSRAILGLAKLEHGDVVLMEYLSADRFRGIPGEEINRAYALLGLEEHLAKNPKVAQLMESLQKTDPSDLVRRFAGDVLYRFSIKRNAVTMPMMAIVAAIVPPPVDIELDSAHPMGRAQGVPQHMIQQNQVHGHGEDASADVEGPELEFIADVPSESMVEREALDRLVDVVTSKPEWFSSTEVESILVSLLETPSGALRDRVHHSMVKAILERRNHNGAEVRSSPYLTHRLAVALLRGEPDFLRTPARRDMVVLLSESPAFPEGKQALLGYLKSLKDWLPMGESRTVFWALRGLVRYFDDREVRHQVFLNLMDSPDMHGLWSAPSSMPFFEMLLGWSSVDPRWIPALISWVRYQWNLSPQEVPHRVHGEKLRSLVGRALRTAPLSEAQYLSLFQSSGQDRRHSLWPSLKDRDLVLDLISQYETGDLGQCDQSCPWYPMLKGLIHRMAGENGPLEANAWRGLWAAVFLLREDLVVDPTLRHDVLSLTRVQLDSGGSSAQALPLWAAWGLTVELGSISDVELEGYLRAALQDSQWRYAQSFFALGLRQRRKAGIPLSPALEAMLSSQCKDLLM